MISYATWQALAGDRVPKMADSKVFVRTASGMVRSISPWGALAMAFMMPGILNPAYLGLRGAGLYPDSYESVSLAMLVVLLPIMTVFHLFSVTMPRLGGDYIYVSRSLSPVLGLVTSWTFAVIFWSWAGFQGIVSFI